jgi:predicted nucleotidyltransferase
MERDEIIETLRRHMAEIRAHGVARLALFGSCVRGEERRDSDVDILVDFEAPVSIFEFLEVKDYLETLLGQPVDLVMRRALKPQLRDRILAEAVSAI